MTTQVVAFGQYVETLHCRCCKATQLCTNDDLGGFLDDDASWPRCCGQRMTTLLPDREARAGDILPE